MGVKVSLVLRRGGQDASSDRYRRNPASNSHSGSPHFPMLSHFHPRALKAACPLQL